MMKKRNLKKLQLKKKSISKLYGGGPTNPGDTYHDTGSIPSGTLPFQTQGPEPGCAWYSELYTACECVSNLHSNCLECPVDYDTGIGRDHHHVTL